MYYPFFRGKQYELVTIRENAELIAKSNIVPIIEPVKKMFGSFERAIGELEKNESDVIVIVNPKYGGLVKDSSIIIDLIKMKFGDYKKLSLGILLREETNISEILPIIHTNLDRSIAIIHDGFSEAKALINELHGLDNITRHIFIDGRCTELYPRHYKNTNRVLVRDGFQRKTNRTYPPFEPFSDLHITYEDRGFNGFGDFLIVGDDYSETGGPAYAVAIHLTYIDSNKDNSMFVFHFVSDSKDTPADPAGKFAEALEKLYKEASRPDTQMFTTSAAVKELLRLREERRYPGLGYVKKLSMQHHLELISKYQFETQS